jgi:hypothetical protein
MPSFASGNGDKGKSVEEFSLPVLSSASTILSSLGATA